MLFNDPQVKSLLASLFIVIAAAPIGRFLVMRRMSLVGDAIGHSLLPGATLGAMLSHSQPWAISLGAAFSGSILFAIASKLTKVLKLGEDTIFAIFYLGAISGGLLIATKGGEHVHLDDLLFGNAERVDNFIIAISAFCAILSIIGIKAIYQPLLFDTIEPENLDYSHNTSRARIIFYVLLTILIVGAFQTMGALLAIGIIILPSICAGLFFENIKKQIIAAALIGIGAILLGSFLSYHFNSNQSAISILTLVFLTLGSAAIMRRKG